MVDFTDFFEDRAGRQFYPDYVLLDNLPIFRFPRAFLQRLAENYALVADFKSPPRLRGFSLPEWDAPHDWKYTHPEIKIYRKKTIQ